MPNWLKFQQGGMHPLMSCCTTKIMSKLLFTEHLNQDWEMAVMAFNQHGAWFHVLWCSHAMSLNINTARKFGRWVGNSMTYVCQNEELHGMEWLVSKWIFTVCILWYHVLEHWHETTVCSNTNLHISKQFVVHSHVAAEKFQVGCWLWWHHFIQNSSVLSGNFLFWRKTCNEKE